MTQGGDEPAMTDPLRDTLTRLAEKIDRACCDDAETCYASLHVLATEVRALAAGEPTTHQCECGHSCCCATPPTERRSISFPRSGDVVRLEAERDALRAALAELVDAQNPAEPMERYRKALAQARALLGDSA